MRRCPRPCLALAAVACAAAIAACGSAGKPGSAAAVRSAEGIKFSDCMRANGVPSFPDPSGGGRGIKIPVGSNINPFSPSFEAARAKCAKLLPGGGPGAMHPTAQLKAQMVAISQCMRAHGISGFPDPTYSPPSSPAGYSILEDRGGVVLAVPDTINVRSPSFTHAAATCGFAH